MSRRSGGPEETWRDDSELWDDPDDLNDDDDPVDLDDDEPVEIPCPTCHEPIYEDAERCPHCGTYVTREALRRQPKPWWVILGVIICLYVVSKWVFWH